MVNTRSTDPGSDQQGQNNQGIGMPMPPPLTPEQYFQLQMQMMATVNSSGTAVGSRAASAFSTTAGPRQACGVSEGSPTNVLPHV